MGAHMDGRALPGVDWRPAAAIFALMALYYASHVAPLFGGYLPGNDDMMRLQQVRDLLAGQGWFDVSQDRFLTPEGGAMHWSRLPDAFLALVILALTPLVGQANAEAIAVAAWPFALLCLTSAALFLVLKRLGAGTLGATLGLVAFATGKSVFQFWPGRIDHHGLELALMMTALAALLAPRAGLAAGALAGACVVLLVNVAIEGLPYAALLVAGAAMGWIVRGMDEARRLTGFGLALAGTAALAYGLDAPGMGAGRAVCDAYGSGHLVALVVGGLALAGLARSGARLGGWGKRLGVSAAAGGLTAMAALLAGPGCLLDPYGNVHPLAAEAWLSVVGEARSLPAVFAGDITMAVSDYGLILAGLVAGAVMVWRAPEGLRLGRALAFALLVFASLVAAWQVRGTLFAHILAAIPLGWAAGELVGWWRARRGVPVLLAMAAGVAAVSPVGWASLGDALAPPKEPGGTAYASVCREADAYEALAGLPDGAVFAPIDLGTSILVHTRHAIFAAPYHRNSAGIARAITIMRAEPETARAMLGDIGADYLVSCQGLAEVARYADSAPDGLGARLHAGDLPDWLEPADGLTETDGVVRVYRVRQAVSRPKPRTAGSLHSAAALAWGSGEGR